MVPEWGFHEPANPPPANLGNWRSARQRVDLGIYNAEEFQLQPLNKSRSLKAPTVGGFRVLSWPLLLAKGAINNRVVRLQIRAQQCLSSRGAGAQLS